MKKNVSGFYPIFENIKSEEFLNYLDSINMEDDMYLQSLPDSWKEGFNINTEIFQSKIEFLLNSNQRYDAETITIMNYILNHEPVMNSRIKKYLDSGIMEGRGISFVLGTNLLLEEYLIYMDKLKRLFEIVYEKVPPDKLTNGKLLYP